jgi:hypothetical protein
MAKLPLPERGQPLDVAYIYQVVSALNDLSAQVSPSTSKYVTIDVPNLGKQSVKASEARIIGGYKDVANNATYNSGQQVSGTYEFGTDFKFAPVVTATPLNIGGTPAGKNVSVVLTSVTTSKVDFNVTFNATGNLTVGLNLLIVGIPQ